jgi:hypothetical protein
MPENPTASQHGVFDRWDASRLNLVSAVKSFLDMSRETCASYTSQALPHSISTDNGFSIALQMHHDLVELSMLEDALPDTRTALQDIPARMSYIKPIERLPNEILGTIFITGLRSEEASGEDVEDSNSHQRGARESSAFLQAISSTVCRRWREVSLDIGVLWTSIELTSSRSLQQANEFIRRSKLCPLDVACDLHPERGAPCQIH